VWAFNLYGPFRPAFERIAMLIALLTFRLNQKICGHIHLLERSEKTLK
jgi:hypothetical protein